MGTGPGQRHFALRYFDTPRGHVFLQGGRHFGKGNCAGVANRLRLWEKGYEPLKLLRVDGSRRGIAHKSKFSG